MISANSNISEYNFSIMRKGGISIGKAEKGLDLTQKEVVNKLINILNDTTPTQFSFKDCFNNAKNFVPIMIAGAIFDRAATRYGYTNIAKDIFNTAGVLAFFTARTISFIGERHPELASVVKTTTIGSILVGSLGGLAYAGITAYKNRNSAPAPVSEAPPEPRPAAGQAPSLV